MTYHAVRPDWPKRALLASLALLVYRTCVILEKMPGSLNLNDS